MSNQPIGVGKMNSRPDSVVECRVKGEPMAFLRPETGEVIIVPAEDANALSSHYNGLRNCVADLHSANRAVRLSVEYLMDLEDEGATQEAKDHARRLHDWSLDWHEEAHGKLRAVYEDLDPLPEEGTEDTDSQPSPDSADAKKSKADKVHSGKSGKKLVELISLKQATPSERGKKLADEMEGKHEDLAFKKKLATFKSAADLKIKSKEFQRYGRSPLVYVNSNKLKKSWPTVKDVAKTKWSEVYKPNEDGKRSLDKEKLRSYVKEQFVGQPISLKTFFGDDLQSDASFTLGEWAESWNETLQTNGSASTAIAGIDFSAGAQLMRFTYGGALNAGGSLRERRVNAKIEGHAAVDLAKAEASLDLYFPRRDGWIWTAILFDGSTCELIAVRCQIKLTASGVVGASIAAELGMEFKLASTESREVKKLPQKKPANSWHPKSSKPKVKGRPGYKANTTQRKTTVSINTDDKTKTGSIDASVDVFAGAEATGTIEGSLQWRDPEHPKKDFVSIASIAPTIGLMAGAAAGAKFKIEYVNGIFRLNVHASLCIGLGAKGGLSFEVSALQIGLFSKSIFYNIAYAQFRNLQIFEEEAFKALKGIQFLAVKAGQSIDKYHGLVLDKIKREIEEVDREMGKANSRIMLAERILSNPALLDFMTPEAKGMLIHQLTRNGGFDVVAGGALYGENYLGPQRKAVLEIIKSAVVRPEAMNIVQHVHENGEKKDFERNFENLKKFFSKEVIGDFDVPGYESPYVKQFNDAWDALALKGDFNGWFKAFHAHLMNEVPHGYPLEHATTAQYEILRNNRDCDHPLFTSNGWQAYYASQV